MNRRRDSWTVVQGSASQSESCSSYNRCDYACYPTHRAQDKPGLQLTLKYRPMLPQNLLFWCVCIIFGPGSIVSTATGYWLDGSGIESRLGARFSAPVQTGPGAHPSFCTMGTGSFPEVKSGRGVTLTPHPLLVPWSWKSRALSLLSL